jgi:hypothetical protein
MKFFRQAHGLFSVFYNKLKKAKACKWNYLAAKLWQAQCRAYQAFLFLRPYTSRSNSSNEGWTAPPFLATIYWIGVRDPP